MYRFLPIFVVIPALCWAPVRTHEPDANTKPTTDTFDRIGDTEPSINLNKELTQENLVESEGETKVLQAAEQLQSYLSGSKVYPLLIIYVFRNDFNKSLGQNILKLVSFLKEQKLQVELEYKISDGNPRLVQKSLMEGLAELVDREVDFKIDFDNDYQKANQLSKSTIIYRDATGAIRLYSLAYEVDKLERQLKRQAAGAL